MDSFRIVNCAKWDTGKKNQNWCYMSSLRSKAWQQHFRPLISNPGQIKREFQYSRKDEIKAFIMISIHPALVCCKQETKQGEINAEIMLGTMRLKAVLK